MTARKRGSSQVVPNNFFNHVRPSPSGSYGLTTELEYGGSQDGTLSTNTTSTNP